LSDITTTPQQLQLVRQSFAKIAPIAEQAAEVFYGRLFEIAPRLRPLFKGDIKAQGRKLMSTIGFAVGRLQQLPELVPVVQDLGRRHAAYGVKDEHYDIVAEALLWTLGQGLGPDFTPDVKEAWVSVYMTLATTMRSSAATGWFIRQPLRPCVDRKNKSPCTRRGSLAPPRIRRPARQRCCNNDCRQPACGPRRAQRPRVRCRL
jgi:hemoglobin-like flavoprotein